MTNDLVVSKGKLQRLEIAKLPHLSVIPRMEMGPHKERETLWPDPDLILRVSNFISATRPTFNT